MHGISLESVDVTRPSVFVRPSTKSLVFIRGPESGDQEIFGQQDGAHISNEESDVSDGEDGWVSGQLKLKARKAMFFKHLDSRVVSREHARLLWHQTPDGNTFKWSPALMDLNSTHGTTVCSSSDGKEVKLEPGRPVSLRDGDKIIFGRKVEKGGEAFAPPILKVRYAFTQPETFRKEHEETQAVAFVDSKDSLSLSQTSHSGQESEDEYDDDDDDDDVDEKEDDEQEGESCCDDLEHKEEIESDGESGDEYGQEFDDDLFDDVASLAIDFPLRYKEEIHSNADWSTRAFSISDDSEVGDETKDDKIQLKKSIIAPHTLADRIYQRTSISASSEEHDTPNTSDVDEGHIDAPKENKVIETDVSQARCAFIPITDENHEDATDIVAQAQALSEDVAQATEDMMQATEDILSAVAKMADTPEELASSSHQTAISTAETSENGESSLVQRTASKKRSADEAELDSPASSPLPLTDDGALTASTTIRPEKRSKLNFRTGMLAGVVTGVVCTFVGLSSLALNENFLV